MGAVSDKIDLGIECDAKLTLDICLDMMADSNDVLPLCATIIDDDECLLGIDPHIAKAFPLPATLLYQPACGDFCAICDAEVRHIWM